MKKLKINIEYTDDNREKGNKKSSQKVEFLKAIFASLVASLVFYILQLILHL